MVSIESSGQVDLLIIKRKGKIILDEGDVHSEQFYRDFLNNIE